MLVVDELLAESMFTLLREQVEAAADQRSVFVFGILDHFASCKQFDLRIDSPLPADITFSCNFEDILALTITDRADDTPKASISLVTQVETANSILAHLLRIESR